MFLVALLSALGAVVAIWYAIITLYCDEPGCHRPARYVVQLIVACVGAVPVGFMVWAAFTNRLRLAVVLLVASLAAYAGWGFLNDAAVHPSRDHVPVPVPVPRQNPPGPGSHGA